MTTHHFMGKRPIHPKNIKANQPITATNLTIGSVVLSQISVDLAIELGFGSMFTNSTNINYTAFLIDVVATMPEVQNANSNTGLDGSVYGTGFRVCLSAVNFDTKNSLSLAGITYSLKAKAVTANSYAQVYGLPHSVTNEISKYLNLTSLDSNFMVDLGRSIQLVMNELTNPTATLQAYPLYCLPASTAETSIQYLLASQGYAFHRLTKGDSFDEAMTRLSKAPKLSKGYPYTMVDEFIAKGVYYNTLATIDENTKPSGYEKNVAKDITNLKS